MGEVEWIFDGNEALGPHFFEPEERLQLAYANDLAFVIEDLGVVA